MRRQSPASISGKDSGIFRDYPGQELENAFILQNSYVESIFNIENLRRILDLTLRNLGKENVIAAIKLVLDAGAYGNSRNESDNRYYLLCSELCERIDKQDCFHMNLTGYILNE